MPIDSKLAAQIAQESGLTLPDASALRFMAEDEDEARELAQQFARNPKEGEDIAERIYTRNRP